MSERRALASDWQHRPTGVVPACTTRPAAAGSKEQTVFASHSLPSPSPHEFFGFERKTLLKSPLGLRCLGALLLGNEPMGHGAGPFLPRYIPKSPAGSGADARRGPTPAPFARELASSLTKGQLSSDCSCQHPLGTVTSKGGGPPSPDSPKHPCHTVKSPSP